MIFGGLGKIFPCRGCSAKLISPKLKFGFGMAIGAFGALTASTNFFGVPLVVVALLVLGAAVLEFGFRKVYLVEE